MKKQMQETVEEANEGITADMLFSACIEEKLPAEMLAAFDVTECLSSKSDCETLLFRDKHSDRRWLPNVMTGWKACGSRKSCV